MKGPGYSGRRQGKEALTETFKKIDELEEGLLFEPQEFIAQGDTVAVVGQYRSRVKATGKIVETSWVHIATVRDGKIVRFREFFDTAAVESACQ